MLGQADRHVVDDHEEERALVAFRDEVEELFLGDAAAGGIVQQFDLGAEVFLRNLEDGRAEVTAARQATGSSSSSSAAV
jgi:hypothetical protein